MNAQANAGLPSARFDLVITSRYRAVIRGAPAMIGQGDYVRIIRGPHAGKRAVVQRTWAEAAMVRVAAPHQGEIEWMDGPPVAMAEIINPRGDAFVLRADDLERTWPHWRPGPIPPEQRW